MISPEKQRVAEKWFHEYFTKGDIGILDEITLPEFVYYTRNGTSSTEQMKEFMQWYRNVFQEDEWVLDDLIEQGDKLVVRYTGWMTYKGGWFNIPAEGQRVKETGIMIFTIEDGKAKELWCENSDAAILYELGALPRNSHKTF